MLIMPATMQPSQDLAGAAHRVEQVDDAAVDGAHDGVDRKHKDADEEHAEQRVDQDRLDALHAFRQLVGQLLDAQHQIARYKTGQQRCQKTAGDGVFAGDVGERVADLGEVTADDTDRKTGTIRDAVGDVAGQNREHEVKGGVADRLKEGRQRRIGAEVCGLIE